MGSSPPIEEVKKGNSACDSSDVTYKAEVHDLLDVGRTEHSESSLPHCHDVTMVVEDAQAMLGDCPGTHMEYCWD